jgi:fructokinase
MGNTLFAIGEALIDFIPAQTGCAFEEVTAFSPKSGGAPANVCGAFTILGGSSKFITQLGDDPFGRKIAGDLARAGIDTSLVSFTDKANTALAFVSLENDGNRTFSFYRKPSADMLFSAEQVKEEWFEDAYALHFCRFEKYFLMFSPLSLTHKVIHPSDNALPENGYPTV